MSEIHPTAIIEEGAQLAPEVTIGAYAYIGKNVIIGRGSYIHHHATVDGNTTLGERNEVFPYAFIGGKTQDLKHTGGWTGLTVGDDNTFREYVTVHCGTHEGEITAVGNHNVMLAYSHIAHDCVVGDHLVMSASSALGGHCVVGNHVNIGWNAGIHQFCRIGDYAMASACSKVVQDIPPYMIADGNAAEVKIFNKVGLSRQGFSEEELALVKFIYKAFYRQGLNRTQACQKLKEHPDAANPVLTRFLAFAESSDRGFA